MKVSRLRSLHARAVLTLTAGIEAVLVVLLVGSPTVGLAATTALTIAYAFELRRLEPDEPCNCFGDVLRVASRSAAIRRNLLLAALALILTVGYASGGVSHNAEPAVVVGVDIVGASILCARYALSRSAIAQRLLEARQGESSA